MCQQGVYQLIWELHLIYSLTNLKMAMKSIKIFDKYLDDLTTGINNLYIMSDGDVIVGGPVAVYLGKYKEYNK